MQSANRIVTVSFRSWRLISTRSSALSQAEPQLATPIEKIPIPPPPDATSASPKIEQLCTEISKLNLIEVSELSALLKKRLNLPDAPMMAAASLAPAARQEEEEEAAPQKQKSAFTVKLMKFDDKQKVPLIKEIKNQLEGMNLVQAKKFVESAPVVVKADIPKDEAEKLKEVLTKVGATIEME